MNAEEIIARLNLKAHPEGGFCVETYRSDERLLQNVLPARYEDPRPMATAIYFLLTSESFSAMHRVNSDEIFHFYFGDPVEMLVLPPIGEGGIFTLGPGLESGMQPQIVVPRSAWQGSRLRPGGELALLGTTVAPGFEFSDFELGRREQLVRLYPHFRKMITALSR